MDDKNYNTLKKYTLASWYLLPLVGLNPYDFGGLDNFYNCFVSPDGKYLFVSVYSPEFCYMPMDSPFYRGDTSPKTSSEHFMVYEIPDYWQDDFVRFMAGEYSKFSDLAKEAILKNCGLPFHEEREGREGTVTDMRLLAISTISEDREILSAEIARMFNCDAPDPNGELLWPPKGDEFIELDPP